jgi:cytoskeletal protein CcmA (bactofilin family)
MGKKKKEDAISTFIGPESTIKGTLAFEGTIRLDGNVEGEISSSSGTMIIGEKAIINAEINVETAIIMGKVTGTIHAKNRIEIYKPAKITGDIQAPAISIDAGVSFNGNCAMTSKTISSSETKDQSIQVLSSEAKGK